MTSIMVFFVDTVVFVVTPWIVWVATRRQVPLAVVPIFIGLGVSRLDSDLKFTDGTVIMPSAVGEVLGWVGIMLLAFCAGLEAQTKSERSDNEDGILKPRSPSARVYATGVLALLFPFVAGTLAAYAVLLEQPAWLPTRGGRLQASMAIGLCLAVSALPVLVGIVRELPQAYRSLGRLSLRLAVIDDAALWAGLGMLLVVVPGSTYGWPNWNWTHGIIIVGLTFLLIGNRALARRWTSTGSIIAWPVGAIYLAAGSYVTSMLGLHALLGCYLAGVMLPVAAARALPTDRLSLVALAGFAPFFFGHQGLSIDANALGWLALACAFALLLLSASAKIAAVVVVSPLPNLSRRETVALGSLLQCKGLMEIVAATILHDEGLLSEMALAVLVTMAIVSTAVTAPAFKLILGTRQVAANVSSDGGDVRRHRHFGCGCGRSGASR